LDSQAYAAIASRSRWEQRQAAYLHRRGRKDPTVAQHVRAARHVEAKAIRLAEEVALLAQWLREDILSVAGADSSGRAELYDFVVAEWGQRVPLCDHHLRPVWTFLKNQRQELLAFVVALDHDLAGVAAAQQVPVPVAWGLLNTQTLSVWDEQRWQQEAVWHKRLGAKYHALTVAVAAIRGRVVR